MQEDGDKQGGERVGKQKKDGQLSECRRYEAHRCADEVFLRKAIGILTRDRKMEGRKRLQCIETHAHKVMLSSMLPMEGEEDDDADDRCVAPHALIANAHTPSTLACLQAQQSLNQ